MKKDLPLKAQRLREARKRAGLTQAEVCERLDISLSTYRRYEQGIIEPRSSVFIQILNTINPGLSELGLMANMRIEDQELSENIKNRIRERLSTNITVIPDDADEATHIANLLRAFNLLNNTGKKTAIERIEELTEIPKYKKSQTEE